MPSKAFFMASLLEGSIREEEELDCDEAGSEELSSISGEP